MERTLGSNLANIAETATISVPGCDMATVAISISGRPATAATSGTIALELDLVQYDLDGGPCLTSFRTARTLRLDLLEQGEAFPHFAAAARRAGVRAVLSLPATSNGFPVATLNLYSRSGPFDESAERVGRVLAAQVSIAVSRSPELAAARTVVEAAQGEVDDRSQIALAAGMLVSAQECTLEQALALLHQSAPEDEQTTLQVARRIIDQHDSTH
ncbi:GAF and ANTAR domain-containing protein [Ilumatobacter sp.]|uniref:GAF and ANTAR domain-containing protein n=1 Tax=Ilumatobacter sp. TaxID=1967498 RepID=UPI003B52AE05